MELFFSIIVLGIGVWLPLTSPHKNTVTTPATTPTTESNFGRYGVLAFSLALILAFILLVVLIFVLFQPCYYCKKRKFVFKKNMKLLNFKKPESNVDRRDDACTVDLSSAEENTSSQKSQAGVETVQTEPTKITQEKKDSDDKTDVVSNHTDELTQKTKESGAGNQEFVAVDLNSPEECSSSESREKTGDETDQPGNSNPSEETKTETKEKKRQFATFLKSIKKYVIGITEKSSVEENEEAKDGLEAGKSKNGAGPASANDVTSTVPPVTDEIKKNDLVTEEKMNAGETLTDNITKAEKSENNDSGDRKINSSDNVKSSEGKADDIKQTDTSEENKNDTNKRNESATSSMAENQPTESAKESSSATSANADETKSDFQQKPDEMKKVENKIPVNTENSIASDVTS